MKKELERLLKDGVDFTDGNSGIVDDADRIRLFLKRLSKSSLCRNGASGK